MGEARPLHARSTSISANSGGSTSLQKRAQSTPIAPHLLIINLFAPEAQSFLSHLNLTQNVTVPGLSPLYPVVYCSESGDLCQMTAGEAEINAAASTSALMYSPLFNFTSTYIFSAGIAGIRPEQGTLGDAGFSRFLVQWALQYELDQKQAPSNWTGGYWAYGTTQPGQYPQTIYGTELFELNTNLLAKVLNLTANATLSDNQGSIQQRATFPQAAAQAKPSVKECNAITSDAYFTGSIESNAVANWTRVITNGTGEYCLTAQEDNAIAEALTRATKAGYADFSRYVVLRTASDFDQAPPQNDSYAWFETTSTSTTPGGFDIAIDNLWNVGKIIIDAITGNWTEWEGGIAPQSGFYGDILGTLDGLGLPVGA